MESRLEEWATALYPTILSIGILWMLKMVQQVRLVALRLNHGEGSEGCAAEIRERAV